MSSLVSLKRGRGGGRRGKKPAPDGESSEGIKPSRSTSVPRWEMNSVLQPQVWFYARGLSVHGRAVNLSAPDAVAVCCRSTDAQCESIIVIWGGWGSRQVSCCTGWCSGPLWCNGRYLLLTCSAHTITELCGGNLCLCNAPPLPPSIASFSLLYRWYLPVCYSVSFVIYTHTDTHTPYSAVHLNS